MRATILQELPLDCITIAPQVRERFDEQELAGLAASMAVVGLQHPVRVMPDGSKYRSINGARRVLAARSLGWKTIPAVIEQEKLTEPDIIQRQLVCAVQTEDLTPIEKAQALDRLMKETGWNQAQAAKAVGLHESKVSKLLPLLLLPKPIQDRIHEGTLPPSTAYEVVKVTDPEARASLLEEAKQGRLTRDMAAKRAKGRAGPKPSARPVRATRPRLERVAIPLGERRSVTISAPELPLPAVVSWIEELVVRLRSLGAVEMSLAEAVKSLNGGQE